MKIENGEVKLNGNDCKAILDIGSCSMLKNFRKFIEQQGINLKDVQSFKVHKKIDKYYWMFMILDNEIDKIIREDFNRYNLFKIYPLKLADYVDTSSYIVLEG